MKIREYKSSDCDKIADLFYNTVHFINAKDYTQEQLNVWATGNIDIYKWDKSFLNNYTLVAEENNMIIGFGDINNEGYLDRLYVHKDYQNIGIATALCDKLEKRYHVEYIITHSSITAKPFFEKRRYKVIKKQFVERNGIRLTNYIMKKYINSSLSAY
ncbi:MULTISPECIES: GNAT family N-acetyltransferase [Romboutsia]|uniref:Acetyltransferase n=1 Tax=Romboutsia hominis TaxID=1507512 RepID=A0A2P2BQH3_9FIRM|nr:MULTISPECIES: GNAT family N-acetyltransferase [Romboutsia]MCH1959899.1 GNAT family N-acetyltransferase [Romboutsia hominis]MCH1969678.1 GNAT family N-acetyltransferase [Romboutsia hominis]MDB8792631.1 GNAT family N-acetyltransferase [Romboutsia sp. 1001216sp1]MDB8796202.1 GNAT family N-acetyltransferase [Romboutsia sp. 1001216sp1]MDB8798195.1 GNAT family N-acetyltransferase [Romboutsia sp. 1001216sp1]